MRERRTMAELTGIITSLFVMLLIDFPETGQVSFIDIDVKDGDDVTLSCGHVKSDQDKCDKTDWLFSFQRWTVKIINQGQISKSKSDRLSVTENCSLVLKKVTAEDVGLYTCRQFDTSGRRQGPDSVVVLSVVTMTEQKLHDKVTFSCQVFRHDHCHQSVKWLFQDKDVDQNNKDFQTSQTDCYANVTFLDFHFIYSSRFKLFKCEVTNTVSGKVQKFSFRRQSSGEETGQDTTTTTTTTTTTKPTAGDSPKASGFGPEQKTDPQCLNGFPGWWRFIIVSVGLATLIIVVVTVNVWTRTKGKKTQMDKNTGRDDDDDDDDDEGDTVTYAIVKASSTDPSNQPNESNSSHEVTVYFVEGFYDPDQDGLL
ncbi:uncharacterized protein LOC113137080 isoform X2 [Mastacembelus armatus]|uniref:uncharacterized protein LOC113137080 isoform X2 n=1 Tax=Mastacembelus armatus TaxID=205130 RepID=UPI000E465F99|nr:uncharacterized protein LOC113137080 isoform X2 [Mastacembelus armatus]